MFNCKVLILLVNFYKFVILERLSESPHKVLIILIIDGEFIQNVENAVILNKVNLINPPSKLFTIDFYQISDDVNTLMRYLPATLLYCVNVLKFSHYSL